MLHVEHSIIEIETWKFANSKKLKNQKNWKIQKFKNLNLKIWTFKNSKFKIQKFKNYLKNYKFKDLKIKKIENLKKNKKY